METAGDIKINFSQDGHYPPDLKKNPNKKLPVLSWPSSPARALTSVSSGRAQPGLGSLLVAQDGTSLVPRAGLPEKVWVLCEPRERHRGSTGITRLEGRKRAGRFPPAGSSEVSGKGRRSVSELCESCRYLMSCCSDRSTSPFGIGLELRNGWIWGFLSFLVFFG